MWIGNRYLRLGRASCLYLHVSASWAALNIETESSFETSMTVHKFTTSYARKVESSSSPL